MNNRFISNKKIKLNTDLLFIFGAISIVISSILVPLLRLT